MKKILLQLDSDKQASVFDSVVAVDAGVDHLFRHQDVSPEQVAPLVHGCIFTRGPSDLHHTAIFIGGSDVVAGEKLLSAVRDSFYGPMQVSVILDANGCNTTAAAAVILGSRHLALPETRIAVLAGTGPVGQRVAKLCLREGATVKLCSRKLDRAESVCQTFEAPLPISHLHACQTSNARETITALEDVEMVFAAGAAGIELLSDEHRKGLSHLKVAIDLNAVPPLGIGGIEMFDKATERDGQICYGAIGVGGTKMKIHKSVIAELFNSNDKIFDAEQIFDVGMSLENHAD